MAIRLIDIFIDLTEISIDLLLNIEPLFERIIFRTIFTFELLKKQIISFLNFELVSTLACVRYCSCLP